MMFIKTLYQIRWFALSVLICSVNLAEAKESNSSKVNLFIGTSGDNGQVDPGAAVPFGMVRVCPDSEPRSHAGYDFKVNRVSGISVNRLSGVGCSGAGGNLSLKPSEPKYDLRIMKQTEKAVPGYYETTFNNGVRAELTATNNIAIERYFFPGNTEMLMTLNLGASFEALIDESHQQLTANELEGYVIAANVCGRGRYKLYFNLRTDSPFKIRTDSNRLMVLSFGQSDSTPVEFRIAVSSVSSLAARMENELIENKRFKKLKSMAADLWEKKLSKVKVEGGTAEESTIL